ncbi:hypothetical protein MXB_4201, partial [Myxobolus squamalis]
MERDFVNSDPKITQSAKFHPSYSFGKCMSIKAENLNPRNSESSEKDSITQSSSLTRSISRTSNDILKLGKDALLIEPKIRNESHIDDIFLYMMEFNVLFIQFYRQLFPNVDHNVKISICHAAKLMIYPPETILIKSGEI